MTSPSAISSWLIIITGCLVLSSCGDFPVYSDTQSISPDGWNSLDQHSYKWVVDDIDMKYDAFIDIRHNGDYPFSNLYLFLDFTFPNGKSRRDTMSCTLADERGRWYGSGLGDMVDHRIMFKDDFEFPVTGNYRLTITHGMRNDPLKGVTDLGFRLERSEN